MNLFQIWTARKLAEKNGWLYWSGARAVVILVAGFFLAESLKARNVVEQLVQVVDAQLVDLFTCKQADTGRHGTQVFVRVRGVHREASDRQGSDRANRGLTRLGRFHP